MKTDFIKHIKSLFATGELSKQEAIVAGFDFNNSLIDKRILKQNFSEVELNFMEINFTMLQIIEQVPAEFKPNFAYHQTRGARSKIAMRNDSGAYKFIVVTILIEQTGGDNFKLLTEIVLTNNLGETGGSTVFSQYKTIADIAQAKAMFIAALEVFNFNQKA